MPGVFSARWAGTGRDDAANLQLVLDQVADVPDEHLGARFVCAAAVALPSGEERVVEGRVLGRLVRSPRGTGGFGYDPIFVPDGYERHDRRDDRRGQARDLAPRRGVPRPGAGPARAARLRLLAPSLGAAAGRVVMSIT